MLDVSRLVVYMAAKTSNTAKLKHKNISSPKGTWRQTGICLAMFLCGMIFFIGAQFLYNHNLNNTKHRVQARNINSIPKLLALSPEEIEKVDIALMNLICAKGLKRTDDIDTEKCLSTIDNWAELIRVDTQLRLPQFHQNPEKYDDSQKLFKLVNMVLYLKDKLGVNYDPASANSRDFSNPDKIFIHGLLDGARSGTCTSIPTLCVAIGRRLGYPLKLVLAKGHIFFRWEDGNDRFNIEACCRGVDSHDDEHYKKWPHLIDEAELQRGHYLRSLTATEELSLFMNARAVTLEDNGRLYEAQVAYANACLLMPRHVPPLLASLSLIDHELNTIAEAESNITGEPTDYAVGNMSNGEEGHFIWRQRLNRPERPKKMKQNVIR